MSRRHSIPNRVRYWNEEEEEYNNEYYPNSIINNNNTFDPQGIAGKNTLRYLPLHDMARNTQYNSETNLVEQIKKLLHEGVPKHYNAYSGDIFTINDVDRDGNTPLHMAVRYTNTPFVQALLDLGADVDVQNNNGETPLMIAIYWLHFDQVKLIMSKNPNVLLRNNEGMTALSIAQQRFKIGWFTPSGIERIKEMIRQLEQAERTNYALSVPHTGQFKNLPINVHRTIANYTAGPYMGPGKDPINVAENIRGKRVPKTKSLKNSKAQPKYTYRHRPSKKSKRFTRRIKK